MSKTTLYVSVDGSDAWSGTYAEPTLDGSDGPFATLERARDEVRALKKAGGLSGPVDVYVRDGIYELERAFALEREDSGTAESPVTYRAYPHERPVLIGGRVISDWEPYDGRMLKADVASQGLEGVYFRDLYYNGKRMHLARYPNFDPENPYAGGYTYVDGDPVPMYEDRDDDSKRVLRYRSEEEREWSHPEEGEVFIFARYNWWNNIVGIESIDRKSRTITLESDCSYPIRPTDRYFVRNLFEELDAPGEWYLDRETWTLYFIPPGRIEDSTVYAPAIETIIDMSAGCSHVSIRGFTIECCSATAVSLDGCSDCLIAANTIRNVGDYESHGVAVTGGFRNQVVGNDVYDVGRDGINVVGGDRKTLTPGETSVDNNYIHHVGIYYRWGCGVYLTGCGLRASHNLIHDCPRGAIQFKGNDLIMEYNHLRHLCVDSEDACGVGTGGRDWISSRGSAVRFNLIHDVPGYGRREGRWVTPHFAWGIYLDDNTGGVDVIGNIVYRCGRGGLHLHNARDTRVENNIFVDNVEYQIELGGWHEEHKFWKTHFPTMVAGYESVEGEPAWRKMRGMETHPKDAPLPSGLIMAGNTFERNVVVSHAPEPELYKLRNVDFGYNRWDRNVLWQNGASLMIEAGTGEVEDDDRLSEWLATGEDPESVVDDPRFRNADADDFRLCESSPAFRLGFVPIPVERIGPYADANRASWPIIEASGVRENPLKNGPVFA